MDGLPESLIESARIITEAASKEQKAVQQAMRKELDKLGVNSPAELSKEKRKDLFNKIDRMFVSDKEKAGKEDDDEAELGANEAYKKKSKVNESATPLKNIKPKFEKELKNVLNKSGLDAALDNRGIQIHTNKNGGFSFHVNGDANLYRKLIPHFKKLEKKFPELTYYGDYETSKKSDGYSTGFTFNYKGVNEAVAGVDPAEEQYFRVEVVNGVSGKMAEFLVASLTKKHAEEEALRAAHDEDDLTEPKHMGGRPFLVVNAVEEISREEFEAEDDDYDEYVYDDE